MEIEADIFERVLRGWAPMVEEFCEVVGCEPPASGALLFVTEAAESRVIICVWIGARVTLMIDKAEQDVLRRKLDLPWRDEEE